MIINVRRAIGLNLLLMLLSALPATGETYYVKAHGNDRLDGLSDRTAWATISKVERTAVAGDTVYFRSQDTWWSASLPVLAAKAGVTYDGSGYGNGTKARATLKATGGYTGNNIEAVVNIFASNVTFRGFEVDGNAQVTGGIYVGLHAPTNISNVTIDNCIVHDNGGPEQTPTKYTYGIDVGSNMSSPTTISDVTITNTTVYNTGHEGIAIYPTWAYPNNKVDGLLVRGCTIHDTAHWGGIDWGDAISVINEADNVTLEFNTIYNAFRGVGVETSTVYTGSPKNLTVRHSIIHDNTFGVIINPASGMASDGVFYGNLIFNNGKPWQPYNYGADILIGEGNYNNTVFSFYNNTIYNTTNSAQVKYCVQVAEWGPMTGSPTINFKNNIVYTSNFTPIRDKHGYLTHANNLVYRSSGAANEYVYSGGTSYNKAGVLTWDPTSQNADPLFTGGTLPNGFTGTYGQNMIPNTDYFTMTSGPAIGHGANLGTQYDGSINEAGLANPVTRPQQGPWNIGAYQ
jgi:hypothetical protein